MRRLIHLHLTFNKPALPRRAQDSLPRESLHESPCTPGLSSLIINQIFLQFLQPSSEFLNLSPFGTSDLG